MTVLAIPDPQSMELSQAANLASSIEQWAEETDDVGQLNDARARLAAIETYLGKKNEEARAEIARADRLVEVRIGQLIGPAEVGSHHSVATEGAENLSKHERSDFRRIAENADKPAVKEAIEAGESRRSVLGKTTISNEQSNRIRDLVVRASQDTLRSFRKQFGEAYWDLTRDRYKDAIRFLEAAGGLQENPPAPATGEPQERATADAGPDDPAATTTAGAARSTAPPRSPGKPSIPKNADKRPNGEKQITAARTFLADFKAHGDIHTFDVAYGQTIGSEKLAEWNRTIADLREVVEFMARLTKQAAA
jgi:hypothetical protein